MGCGCKGVKNDTSISDEKGTKIEFKSIVKYSLKILVFLMSLVLLPILGLLIIWFLFRTIVLNKNVDIKPLLVSMGEKFNKK